MKFSLATIALLAAAVSAMPNYHDYSDNYNNHNNAPADNKQCKPTTVTYFKTHTLHKTKTKTIYATVQKPAEVKTKKLTKTLIKTVTPYAQPVTETITKTVTKTYTAPSHPPAQKGQTYNVVVGGSNNGQPVLKYTPEFVYAQPGDTVVFDFMFKNHTVTESTFDKPCEEKMGGFDSGYKPNLKNIPGTSKYQVTVKDTQPHWVYCAQGPHCQLGMVFAINPPKTGNTYQEFLLKAKAKQPASGNGKPYSGGNGGNGNGNGNGNGKGKPDTEKDSQDKPADKKPVQKPAPSPKPAPSSKPASSPKPAPTPAKDCYGDYC